MCCNHLTTFLFVSCHIDSYVMSFSSNDGLVYIGKQQVKVYHFIRALCKLSCRVIQHEAAESWKFIISWLCVIRHKVEAIVWISLHLHYSPIISNGTALLVSVNSKFMFTAYSFKFSPQTICIIAMLTKALINRTQRSDSLNNSSDHSYSYVMCMKVMWFYENCCC